MTLPDTPYREHVPPSELAGVVDRFWTKRTRAPSGPARILPDGCVDVLFHLAPERARVVAVGAMTCARSVPPAASDVVAVRFRPGGAARFFDLPVDALTDAQVELGELGLDARSVMDAMLEARSSAARRAHLERFVHERVAKRGVPSDRLLARAVARLVSPRPPAIGALAGELGISRQHLTRRVRAAVGLGPKELARVARMQRALSAIASGCRDHAALAYEHGYCDQSHLVSELRALTGLTPGALAAAPGSISPITSPFDVPGLAP